MSLASQLFNSTMEIALKTNSTNESFLINSTQQVPVPYPYENFVKVAFGSAIYMFVASFITILANGLLLLAFCIDPLKIFRNSTTFFLVGLAIVDLLTALVHEPIYASCFLLLYLKHPSSKRCPRFMDFAQYFSAFCMTASFIIMFAFTLTQYIVVSSPLKLGRLVSKTKVLVVVASTYVYSALFWSLHLMGVPSKVQFLMELFIHNYILVIATTAIYIFLHLAIRKKMAAGSSLQGGQTGTRDGSKHTQVQRNFVRVNFMLLVVLIVCATPSTVSYTVLHFVYDNTVRSEKFLVANLMIDNLLYMKLLLDPFVYAWRMPKYRESVSKLLCCKNRQHLGRKSTGDENRRKLTVGESRDRGLSAMELNRSVITLLSFKNISESPVPME